MAKNIVGKKKKVSKIKVKKKIWFKVMSPKLFGSKLLGESYLQSADKAIGRVVRINLKNLTGSMRDQNADASFKITSLNGTTLQTAVIAYELTQAYVKRAVRKNANKLDDYFELETKAGQKVILKSLMITTVKTQRSTQSALRKALKEFLTAEVKKTDFEGFVTALVAKKIQIAGKKALQKVHPLKEVAVRVIKLQGPPTKAVVMEELAVTEEAKEAVEEAAEEAVKESVVAEEEAVTQ